jgi:uncharacterized surface protein with fasciclin (FAS1) repeats
LAGSSPYSKEKYVHRRDKYETYTQHIQKADNRLRCKLEKTKQTMKSSLKISAAAALAALFSIASATAGNNASASQNIVEVAASAGQFKTLVAAVQAAGLADTLSGPGPFTVFAPTDEAFAKLPKGTVEELLKPENKQKLVGILTYHVLPGKVMAADVKTMEAKTVNGANAQVKVAGETVTIDNAKVVKTDIAASNGVIHVIDTVIMP